MGFKQVSQHIYPIVITKSGQAVCMDAVNTYGGFNSELPYDELIGVINSDNYPLSIGEQPQQTKNISPIVLFLMITMGVYFYQNSKN